MISFEKALWEASHFTTKEKTRYDLDCVLVEDYKIAATDGKKLYVADVDSVPFTGLIKRARIKGGNNIYPKPKKNMIGKGISVIIENGKKYLETLGTRFEIDNDKKFPPYQRIISKQAVLTAINGMAFKKSLADLYSYGKQNAKIHLYNTGIKARPKYRAILYKNSSLHLITECALGENEYFPVHHTELIPNYHGDKSIHVFNPDLYPLKEEPLAISIKDGHPIQLSLTGRQVFIMPILLEELPVKMVQNFVMWEEYVI